MDNNLIYNAASFFFIYAFLGWCTEVVYAALVHGRFVNRGFLNGPVCPIYGFGVVIVLLILEPIQHNFALLYLGSVALTTALELVTGFVLDKLFHKHWWDYSKERLNLKGYICLKFSLVWGFACLIVVDIIHPVINEFVKLMPDNIGVIILIVLSFAIVSDMVMTVVGISRTGKHLRLMQATARELREISDSIGSGLSSKTLHAAERHEEAKAERGQKREARREKLAELQKRYEELRANMPMTGRRIQAAFPDLELFERRKEKKENK